MLSSNMKNEHIQLFTKSDIQAKEGEKIKLFMLLLIQGYFLWCITFLCGIFLHFFKSFALGIKFCMIDTQF